MADKGILFKREIIKKLYFSRSLSCADLSALTGKSLPHTTKYLNELINEGSIIEKGFAHSTGGRRPQMYALRADLHYIIAVSMDQLLTKIAILDLDNKQIGEKISLELCLTNNPVNLIKLKDYLKSFISSTGIPKNKFIGIGISMPGFVEVNKGINHSFLPVSQGSVVGYLKTELGLPVLIDNDSSLIGLAEMRLGSAIGFKNAMVINLGWGVGLGMSLNNELFRGHNGFAGEFSHIPVFKDNKKICSCGKMGCLETETSLLSIIQKAKEGLASGRISVLKNQLTESPENCWIKIMEAANKGDTFAVELFSEAGHNLGLGIAILITLMNPELIVISGRGAAMGKLWLAPIQQAINEHCIPKIAEETQIRISSLHGKIDLMGAAALVMENFESLPYVAGLKRPQKILSSEN